LRNLSSEDQVVLWALLKLYDAGNRGDKKRSPVAELEKLTELAKRTAQLAQELGTDVFSGPMAPLLSQVTTGYEHLPKQLGQFSTRLGTALSHLGKPGRKYEVATKKWLVVASEFVRLKSGQYYDEHLTELFQAIREDTGIDDDFSGDAIRKQRERMSKEYPAAYQAAIIEARHRNAHRESF